MINEENNDEETETEYEKKLKAEFSNINTEKELFPVYYNAWEEDGNTDPLLTILYSLIENTGINLKNKNKKIKDTFLNIVKGIEMKFGYNNQITGQGFEIGIGYNSKNKKVDMFEEINSKKNLKLNIENIISELLKEKKFNRLIIFVDELDRCKPTFAVELLERIKNYLNNSKIIFIFSTDIYQLQYTIKKVYGEGFDGIYYLEKFFDMQTNLPKIPMDKYIKYKNSLTEEGVIDEVSIEEFEILQFNLRDCNKYFKLIDLIREYAQKEKRPTEANTYILINCIIIPILLMLKIKKANTYYKINKGNGKQEFVNEISKNSVARFEIEQNFMTEEEKSKGMINETIAKIYEKLFIEKRENYMEIEINRKDEFGIGKKQKKEMEEILTFMNEYLNYEDNT